MQSSPASYNDPDTDDLPVRVPVWLWLGLYAAIVLIFHLALIAFLLLFWPPDAPLRVWDIAGGITASAVVALIAGVITIVVSRWSAADLEHVTVAAITDKIGRRLEHSLNAPVTSVEAVRKSLISLIKSANEDGQDSLVLLAADVNSALLDLDAATLLSQRLRNNWHTWFVTSIPAWISAHNATPASATEKSFWETIVQNGNSNHFFDDLNFFICPASVSSTLEAVRFVRRGNSTQYEGVECLITVEGRGRSDVSVVGIRTSIDRHLNEIAAERICDRLSEPRNLYTTDMVALADVQDGRLSGIPVTRSLITSQVLIAMRNALHVAPGIDDTQQLFVIDDPSALVSQSVEFRYDAALFLPPLRTRNSNHSGSVVGRLLAEGRLDVCNKGVLEIGCGPGFLSVQIARRLGDTGYLIANDCASRALQVAELNVRLSVPKARAQYEPGDCNALQLQRKGNDLWLTCSGGNEKKIDLILVELPLLTYRGHRALHSIEMSYMEQARDDAVLPPSLEQFVSKVAPDCIQCHVPVVVPLCAGNNSEYMTAINRLAVLSKSPSSHWVRLDDSGQDGFVRCVMLSVAT